MAASAIVSVGVRVDKFADGQIEAYVQSGLIRLGHDIGNIDGRLGPRTNDAIEALGGAGKPLGEIRSTVDALLQKKFPEEFFDRTRIRRR